MATAHKKTPEDIISVQTTRKTNVLIKADPYDWPHDGGMDLETIALVCVDWQTDFCKEGGYIDSMGIDLAGVARGIEPTKKLIKVFRDMNLKIIHTREGYRPDMTDCSKVRMWRSQKNGKGIGSDGPKGRILIRGEPGWEIIDDLKPNLDRAGKETIIDKASKGAFGTTEIELILNNMGVRYLIFTGITTDVCVHTIIREACDKGFDTLLLEDCTGATEESNYKAALEMVRMQGGIFGSVTTSTKVLEALEKIQQAL